MRGVHGLTLANFGITEVLSDLRGGVQLFCFHLMKSFEIVRKFIIDIFQLRDSVHRKSYQQQRRLSEVLSHVARVIILPNEEQISYWSRK